MSKENPGLEKKPNNKENAARRLGIVAANLTLATALSVGGGLALSAGKSSDKANPNTQIKDLSKRTHGFKYVEGREGVDYFNSSKAAEEYLRNNPNVKSYDPKDNTSSTFPNTGIVGELFHDEGEGELLGIVVKTKTKYGPEAWVVLRGEAMLAYKEQDGKRVYEINKCGNPVSGIEPVYKQIKHIEVNVKVEEPLPVEAKPLPMPDKKDTEPCFVLIPYKDQKGQIKELKMQVWLSDDKRTNGEEKFLTVSFPNGEANGKDKKPNVIVFNDQKEVEKIGKIKSFGDLIRAMRENKDFFREAIKRITGIDAGPRHFKEPDILIPTPIFVNGSAYLGQGTYRLPPQWNVGPGNILLINGRPFSQNQMDQWIIQNPRYNFSFGFSFVR